MSVEELNVYLCTGLHTSVIESQMIANALALRKYGVHIEIWALCLTNETFQKSKARESSLSKYGLPLRIFHGIKPAIPFSDVLNAIVLTHAIKRWAPRASFIHCRSDDTAAIASLAKIFGVKQSVIWDCRGDAIAEEREQASCAPGWKQLAIRLKLTQIRARRSIAKHRSDYAVFVSEAMQRSLLGSGYPHLRSVVIPCIADKELFYFNESVRRVAREKLGIQTSSDVILYSGSQAAWQCIPETVDLIRYFLRLRPDNRAIVLTQDPSSFSEHFPENIASRVIIKSAAFNEVNEFLNAADFGIFLRKHSPVNWVASPVKFAEYALTGLPVLMTDAVDQSNNIAIQIGNKIEYSFGVRPILPSKFEDAKRRAISHLASQKLTHEVVIGTFLRMYAELRLSDLT